MAMQRGPQLGPPFRHPPDSDMPSNADLLHSLKIDRAAPPPPPSRKGLWIALAVAGALVLALALRGGRPLSVQVAEATAIGGGAASAPSVLDASGYVVARRMATVSAKVTGRVREVLIEEGQKVAAGQVLARLDPVDADAQRQLAAAQLAAARSQIGSVRN
jgi:multidrug efflux pump subunit AcrA (membrane-fusion protein)